MSVYLEKKDYNNSENKLQISTKSYKGVESARDLTVKEKIKFQNFLDREFVKGIQVRTFLKECYQKTGLSDQRFKGGIVLITIGMREDTEDYDFDVFIQAKNEKEVSNFQDFVEQFIQSNKILVKVKGYDDATVYNRGIGLLDVTCSINEYKTRSRTNKERTEIYIDIENDTKDPCLIFPSNSKNHEEFVKKQEAITSGCELEELDKLKGPLLPFFFNMFTHGIIETDSFITKLYQKYFIVYKKNTNNDFLKNYSIKQIGDYIDKHTRKEHSGSRLALLLNMALSAYRNYGINVRWEDHQLFLNILWGDVIYPQMKELLNEEIILIPKKEIFIYQFVIDLIHPIEDFTKSTDTIKNIYNNIASSLYLRYMDPLLYQLSKISPNIIQMLPNEDGLKITSLTGKETLSGYVFSHPPLIAFQKIDIDIEYIRKDIFDSSWFIGFKSFLTQDERSEFSHLFKIMRSEKTTMKIQDVFKKLSDYLNIKKNPFEIYSPPENVSIDHILKQWDRILIIWKKDINSSEEYSEWLNGMLRIISVAQLLDPTSDYIEKWNTLYFQVLTNLLISDNETGKLFENYALSGLNSQQMVCRIMTQIDAHDKNIHILLMTLIPYLIPLQNLNEEEKNILTLALKNLLPSLIRKMNDESTKDLTLLLHILQLTDSNKKLVKKVKKETSVKTGSLMELQNQLKKEVEIGKLIGFIQLLQKQGKFNDLDEVKRFQENFQLLTKFFLSNYDLDDKNALNCWLELFKYCVSNNLTGEASNRLKEIFLYGDSKSEEIYNIDIHVLLSYLDINNEEFNDIQDKHLFNKYIDLAFDTYMTKNISAKNVGTTLAFLFSAALVSYKKDRLFFESLWTHILYPKIEEILKKKHTIESQKERLIYQFIKDLTKDLTKSVDTLNDLYQNISSSLYLHNIDTTSEKLSNKKFRMIQMHPEKGAVIIELVKNAENCYLQVPAFLILLNDIDDIQKNLFSSSWFANFTAPLNKEEKIQFLKLFKSVKSNKNKFKTQEIFNQLSVFLNIKKNPLNACLIPKNVAVNDILKHWDLIFTRWRKSCDSNSKSAEWLNGMSRIISVAYLLGANVEKWISLYLQSLLKLFLEDEKETKPFEVYAIPFLSPQQMTYRLITQLDSSDSHVHKVLTTLLAQTENLLQGLNEEEKKNLLSYLRILFVPFIENTNIESSTDLKYVLQLIQIIYSKKEVGDDNDSEKAIGLKKEPDKLKLVGFLHQFTKKLQKEVEIQDPKDQKKFIIFINFYLNFYSSLDDESSLNCWMDLFNYFLNINLPKEAHNRLKEIFLLANLKEEEQIALCFQFLKKTKTSADHWPIVEKTAKFLLNQKNVSVFDFSEFLMSWNEIIKSCEIKHNTFNQTDSLFEQLIIFFSSKVDEEQDLLAPIVDWVITNITILNRLLQIKKDEDNSRSEKIVEKVSSILLKRIEKNIKMDVLLLKNISSFLYSLAKTVQFSKLSEDSRKLISSIHYQLLSKHLIENQALKDVMEVMGIRRQWIFLEKQEEQIQLNLRIIQAFFNLELKEVSSDLLEEALTKILEIFKSFNSENEPKELAVLLIKGGYFALEKRCFSAAAGYYSLVSDRGLIKEHDDVLTLLKPIVEMLTKEKYLASKIAIPLQAIIEKFFPYLSLEDLSHFYESLLETSHSCTFCINLTIKNKISDEYILKIIFKKVDANKIEFLNNILPHVLVKIQKKSSAAKDFIFLLENIPINLKNSKQIPAFIKKMVEYASDFSVDEVCLLSKYISKLPLKNMNISLKDITAIIIKNWTKSEKAVIKKIFNALDEKDIEFFASEYFEIIFLMDPCLDDLLWISEESIKYLKKNQARSLVKFYIQEKKLESASVVMAIFMKETSLMEDEDYQLLLELHLQMLLADPTSALCWQAASYNIKYVMFSINSMTENDLNYFISTIDKIMQPENFRFLASKNRHFDFFNVILPIVCHPNMHLDRFRNQLENKIKVYYHTYIKLLVKSKSINKINYLSEFLITFVFCIRKHSANYFIPELCHEFLITLLYESFSDYIDRDEILKNNDGLVSIRLNIIDYIANRNLSYRLLNYWISLTEEIENMPINYLKTHVTFLELLGNRLMESELLTPIVRAKILFDDYFRGIEEYKDIVTMHIRLKFYLCIGLLKVKNLDDIPEALDLLIKLLEELYTLSKKNANSFDYFVRTNRIIQLAVNLNIELKTTDRIYYETKKSALEKIFNASDINENDIFKIRKRMNDKEIDRMFNPINLFIIEFKNQLNDWEDTEFAKELGLQLFGACIRLQCYASNKKIIIKESSEVPLVLSTYVAIGRQKIFVLENKPSDVIDWLKKIKDKKNEVKEELSIITKEIILQNVRLLIQESFLSESSEHQDFAWSLISLLEELFDISKEEEIMHILSEVIVCAFSNPDTFNFKIFKNILLLINKYVIDTTSKVLFKNPEFFMKKIIDGTLILRYVEFSKSYPEWMTCMNYVQDLLYHRCLPLDEKDVKQFHDKTVIRWTKYHNMRLKNRDEEIKQEYIQLPKDIGEFYDSMIVSFLQYMKETLLKYMDIKPSSDIVLVTFNFFKNFKYLANPDAIEKELRKLLE